MRRFFDFIFPALVSPENVEKVRQINHRRSQLEKLSDHELKILGKRTQDLLETIAVTAVVVARVLGLVMFDVQLQGSLAMAEGRIAEMQTGEGKTIAAV